MKFIYYEKDIILNHLKYELELLKRFDLLNCNAAVTPIKTNHKLDSNSEGDKVDATIFKKLVGSLRYLCNTIPHIFYEVGIVSRFISKPKWSHCQATVRILSYIKGTLKYGVLFLLEERLIQSWCVTQTLIGVEKKLTEELLLGI